MKRLTFTFPNAETRSRFVGWFLDGGGEYTFNDGNEMNDEPRMRFRPPREAARWDWQTKGEDADEHVIECVPYPPEDDDAPADTTRGKGEG